MSEQSREHPEWTARLSDFLSDELGAAQRSEVEAHLASCAACSRALADLTRIVEEAEALDDVEPPTDLWAGVADGIAGDAARAPVDDRPHVLPFPSRRGWAAIRRSSPTEWSAGSLAAAAVVLVAVTASLSWWAGSSRGAAPAPATGQGTDAAFGTVMGVAEPPAELAQELAALERLMDSARGALDPNTIRVIERSLAVIEQAIADSREALALDPGNAFLAGHLERMYRRKLVYLRDAVRFADLGV